MPSATRRTELIFFERATFTEDESGTQVPSWAALATRRASVRFGSGQESREAAKETGVQSATFECVASQTLLNITLKDRIVYLGSTWDIVENSRLDTSTIRFTATRTL